MSLFSSLYTGVSGMNAQSDATAAISDNIANSTTVGFKKYDTTFQDLVVNKTKPNNFSHGGVMTQTIQRIDRQGQIQQTQSRTELAVNGQGFFAVKRTDDPNLEFLYTRNGSFNPDQNGVLRNAAGFALYGWPVDTNGNVIEGDTLTSLQLVDVDELNETFRQTTSAEFGVNLDAAEIGINPETQFPAQSYPVNNLPAHFSRNINIVDGDGVTRDVTFEFRKITGPMASAASGASGLTFDTSLFGGNLSNVNPGDAFSINAGGSSQEYIIGAPAGAGQVRVDTVGELANHINTQFGGGTTLDAILDVNGRLTIKRTDITDNINFNETVGNPLTGGPGTFDLIDQLGTPALLYNPYDINAAYPDQNVLPGIANTIDPSTNGWWELTILTPDPTDPTNPALAPVELHSGLLSFNSDGTLNAAPDANGNIEIALNNMNFDNASTTDTTSITVDISRFEQFAAGYNVIIENQNGAEAGILDGVDVQRDGTVIASFTNGEEFAIFQVPLVRFVNPNGLEDLSGTVFAQTEDAGALTVVRAGTSGAGVIRSSALEQSNVDIADEFANLIVSQRAFQASSRVVNTVDEMTQELRSLKR